MRLLIVLALVAVAASTERVRRDGWRVLRAKVESLEQAIHFKEMMDNGIDFWEEPSKIGGYVTFVEPPTQTGINFVEFFHLGIDVEVVRENLQDDYDAAAEYVEWYYNTHSGPDQHYDYGAYNPYETIIEELDIMVGQCPTGFSCSVRNIGSSFEGSPINVFSITGSGSGRRGIWLDSTIHAREWLSTATNMNIMRRVVTGTDAEAVLMRNYDWHFLPVMNPDGYTYSWVVDRMWRKCRNPNSGTTCVGTDLNRNYPFGWGMAGASSNPCSTTYRGSGPQSTSETRAVVAEGNRIGSTLDAWLSIHTFGNYILIPFGNCDYDETDFLFQFAVADDMSNAIEATYGTRWLRGNSCEVLYATSGSTSDWTYGGAGVLISYTPELRGGRFDPGTSQIAPSYNEFWNGVVAMITSMEGRKNQQ